MDTNLYIQRPMNNAKPGKLYWFMNNPDFWKIQQILHRKFLNYKKVSIKGRKIFFFPMGKLL